MKVFKNINTFEAMFERMEYIFNEFDNIIFSFSGGKDSSLMIQVANIVAKKMNKKFDVLFIDLEAQYQATIEHVYELKQLSQIREFNHIALPLYLRNAVSIFQPKWVCWNPEEEKLWVRELPKDSINLNNNNLDFYKNIMEFEEFVKLFNNHYKKTHEGKCGIGVGIRADESLNRFRTIAFPENKTTYKGKPWTTKLNNELYNFYPIYDLTTEDVWGCVSKLNLKFNLIYELMFKNGVSIHEQRLCQPYGDDQRNGLDQFKTLEFKTWEKVLNRVSGVNFGNIYCRTTALGNIKTSKPEHMNWQEYTIFLLESIMIYNKDLGIHYYNKIKKFMKFYKDKENIDIKDIKDIENLKNEASKKVISWRRIARAIEKNDFYMTRLSFSQTKKDYIKLKELTKKYNNLLDENTEIKKKIKESIYEEDKI